MARPGVDRSHKKTWDDLCSFCLLVRSGVSSHVDRFDPTCPQMNPWRDPSIIKMKTSPGKTKQAGAMFTVTGTRIACQRLLQSLNGKFFYSAIAWEKSHGHSDGAKKTGFAGCNPVLPHFPSRQSAPATLWKKPPGSDAQKRRVHCQFS